MPTPDPAREEAEKAAAEAAAIGGRASSEPPPEEPVDEAFRAVIEGGGGEAEGFEQAESELIEHASHGDQHAARQVIEDAPEPEESDDARAASGGEADHERSSERDENSL